jgi:hypothetical protein
MRIPPGQHIDTPHRNPRLHTDVTTRPFLPLSDLKWSKMAVVKVSTRVNMESRPRVMSMVKKRKDQI